MKTNTTICPNCHRTVDPDAPSGICPECLLGAAISTPAATYAATLPRRGTFTAPQPETLSRAIPSLEVLELLGQGGMGAVYRARQINLDRPVALKILSPQLGRDPGFAERFAREAKTLAKLNHPNIVTIYDFGRTAEFCYLIMELIEGVNLRDAIITGGISPDQALAIIPRICEALQYAHDQGVVHRDIKPENILVGLNDQVKIADFGLAKMLDHAEANFTLTATQQVLGTRNYMAPEQIEKPATVDHRADIYSLGVVFYELLTGELPLGRFSLPSEKSNVNSELDEIVMRTLEKEPARRFQKASQVKTAVESIDLSRESPLQPVNGIPSTKRPPETSTNKPPVVAELADQPLAAEPLRRKISLPFKNDQVHGGLSQLHGIAHLGGDALEIEYRVHNLGVAKSPKRTIRIPYSRIVNTLLTRGMFSNSLEIQSGSLETFDDIPGTIQGRLKMTLDKTHDQLSEEFRSALDTRVNAATPDGRRETFAATASSLAHVPFTITDVHGGFSEAAGIAKVTQHHLVVEFEIKDALGVVKSAPRIALVPLNDIISVEQRRGIIRDTIAVQTNGIDSVSTIPNSSQGKFKLNIRKRDRGLTENLLRQTHRLTGLPLPEMLVEVKPIQQQERHRQLKTTLRPFQAAVAVMVLLDLLFCGLMLFVILLGNPPVLLAGIQNVMGLFSDRELGTGDLILRLVSSPLLGAVLGMGLWWLLRTQQSRWLVGLFAILLAVPLHPGVVIGFPLAILLVATLLNSNHARAWRTSRPA